LGSKRRRVNLSYFNKKYYKVGVIFPILSDEEYISRNDKRVKEENKNIPGRIVKGMIEGYQPIRPKEGFDRVISL